MTVAPLPQNPWPLIDRVRQRVIEGKATADEVEAAQRLAILSSPASMLAVLDPNFRQPAHIRIIDQHLVALHRGHMDRLMIVAPPRAGKSYLSSQAAPLWRLRQKPEQQGIATHGADLSEIFGGWSRNQITSQAILDMQLRRDSKAKSQWTLNGRQAGLWAVGIGTGINGRGYVNGHADDLIRSMEEAMSAPGLDKQWDWWVAEFLTRRTRTQGRVTLSACWTRWGELDVGGRILATERERWTVLHLKAIAEQDETLATVTDADPDTLKRWEDDDVSWSRNAGEALWPDAYPLEYLAEYQSNRYIWSALFQGEPTPTAGGLFRREDMKYWKRVRAAEGELWALTYEAPIGEQPRVAYVRPRDCRIFATCDLAASTRTSADFTVIAVWAVTPQGDLLLVDRYRGRIAEQQHWNEAQKLHARWKFQWMSVEKSFVGSRLVYDAARAGLTVRDYDPRVADKITRAMPAVDRYGAGRVWHPDAATHPWVLTEMEPELLGFGGGAAHDDWPDAVAQAVHFVPNPDARRRPGTTAPSEDSAISDHIRRLSRTRRHVRQVGY